MASEAKHAEGGAGSSTPRRNPDIAALSESKAKEVMAEEAKRAAPTGYWPDSSSPEDLKFMLESVMSLVERQNTTIRRLQAQVTELWRENTARGHASAFERSDKLVVVGFTRYVEAYSHDTGDWREMPSMPTARRDCAVASCRGKLYVVGGTSGKTGRVMNIVEIYDPATKTWTTGPPLFQSRASASAIDFNGEVCVVGGSDDDHPLASVEIFNPDDGKWRLLKPMSEPREGPAAVQFKGRLVVAGGRGRGNVATSNSEEFDLRTETWHALPNLPSALGLCSAAVLDGNLVVAGNGATYGGALSIPGAVFELVGDTWKTKPDRITTATSSGLALETLNGKLVAVASEGAEEYDPVIDDWVALPQSRVRHFGCDAAVLNPTASAPGEAGTPMGD